MNALFCVAFISNNENTSLRNVLSGGTVSGLFQRNQNESLDGGNYLFKAIHGDDSGRFGINYIMLISICFIITNKIWYYKGI